MDIFRFPEILVIHLKRFKSSLGKSNINVDFPINGLDLSPYSIDKSKNLIYNLHGVVVSLFYLYFWV